MYNIGITGVGGGVGQSIIKALQNTDYRLIGMDGEKLGAGLYAVDEAYTIPYAANDGFINAVLNVCREKKINILFPGLDAELFKFSEHSALFADIGTVVIVSRPEVIDISENKWSTYEKLAAAGFNVPLTYKLVDYSEPPLDFPFIIKPYLGGARSKDVFKVNNIDEYKEVLNEIANRKERFIAQEFLAGDEYTCGTITLDGKCKGAIIMKRELRNGDTYKCHSVDNKILQDYLVNMMNVLQPFGACNVQLKLKEGKPFIFEINARCSGTTAARALCGFNEPKLIADYILKEKATVFEIQEKTILRYWNELEVDNEMLGNILTKGYSHAVNRMKL